MEKSLKAEKPPGKASQRSPGQGTRVWNVEGGGRQGGHSREGGREMKRAGLDLSFSGS